MSQALQTIFDNLINGNLKEAKAGARNYGTKKLAAAYQEYLGCTSNEAALAALFLKDRGSFQDYCNAVYARTKNIRK